MKTLKEMIQPGLPVRVFYDSNNPNNELRHIRAIVDDDMVVYRVWNVRKQSWRYYVTDMYEFELKLEKGVIQ